MEIKNKIFFLLIVVVLVASMTLWPNEIEEDVISTETQKEQIIIPEVLKKIAWCESKNRQFNDDGSIHRGEINPKDIGYFQINEYWNGEEALSLGFDIYTLEGNTKMALHLYSKKGSQPWNWSSGCWNNPNRVWIEKEGEYFSK